MTDTPKKLDRWSIEIEGMPQFDESMKRVEAWCDRICNRRYRLDGILHPIDLWFDHRALRDYAHLSAKTNGMTLPAF